MWLKGQLNQLKGNGCVCPACFLSVLCFCVLTTRSLFISPIQPVRSKLKGGVKI